MILNCPASYSIKTSSTPLPPHPIIRKGYFRRKSDSHFIQRYECKSCGLRFSKSTLSPKYYQKLRRINHPLKRLITSGVSQTRAALLLGVDPKTIARRLIFIASEARRSQKKLLKQIPRNSLMAVQFDDLETSIHTRCKPVSVALMVEPKTRKILGFQASPMPAKGRLAAISLKKYGKRKDLRPRGWNQLLRNSKELLNKSCEVTSDENPLYPKWIKRHLPQGIHVRIPGGRGSFTGQGELRDKKFDPMFALNHTCAMLRANINRLFRKTWCTSKRLDRLSDHIAIYVDLHNRLLTPSGTIFGGS